MLQTNDIQTSSALTVLTDTSSRELFMKQEQVSHVRNANIFGSILKSHLRFAKLQLKEFQMHACNRYDSSTKNTKTSTLYWCAILVFLNMETSESHTGLVLPLVGPDELFQLKTVSIHFTFNRLKN